MTYARDFPDVASLGWNGTTDHVIIRNILDSMSDSLIVLGDEGQVLYANKITADILGYSLEELKEKGVGLLFLVNEDNYEFNQIFVDAVWKKSINEYSEVDYVHPDGSTRRLAATTSYLLADGRHESTFIGFVAMFKDITETHNLRKKERELTLEKERIAKEKFNSLHKLAMGVAHEIRNPVVTIAGFAHRISKNEKNPDETRHYARNIFEDAKKLETVVDEVQQYCNLPEVRLSMGNVAAVMEKSIADMAARAGERNIRLVIHDFMPEGTEVLFDPALVKTALLSLLENAVDFSPDGAVVELGAYQVGDQTVIEVRDSGSGIREQDLEFIFNPFFSTRTHGSGMGLAVVERIVHEHMGKMEVESEPDVGTTIRLILPGSSSVPLER